MTQRTEVVCNQFSGANIIHSYLAGERAGADLILRIRTGGDQDLLFAALNEVTSTHSPEFLRGFCREFRKEIERSGGRCD